MELKMYCAVSIGKFNSALITMVKRISEDDVKVIAVNNVFIATFSTHSTVNDIKSILELNIESGVLFVFELNNETSDWFISDAVKDRELFQTFYKNGGAVGSDKFFNLFKGGDDEVVFEDFEVEVMEMSNKEREKLLDEIIGKGYENLNNIDREKLNIIGKYL